MRGQNYGPIFYVEIADSARKMAVQNLGLGVQNYDPVFYVETALGGCMSPAPNLNRGWHKKEGCTKFGTWCTKLYKIRTKL